MSNNLDVSQNYDYEIIKILKLESENMNTEFKTKLKNWALNSSLHGIASFTRTKNSIHRVMWLVCLLAAASLCITLMSKNIKEYLDFPVTTKMRYVHEKQTEFPGVGVCNSNSFVTDYFIRYLVNFIKIQYGKSKPSSMSNLEFINESAVKHKTFRNDVIFSLGKNSNSMLIAMGLSIDDLILSCYFNDVPCNLNKDFIVTYSFEFGNCFFFNTDAQIKVKSHRSVLSLELFAGFEETSPSLNHGFGFKIFIYNQSNSEILNWYFKRYSLSTNTEMTMAVQKNYIDKLKYPYSDCNVDLRSDKFESRFSLKLKRNNQTYKQEFCFEVVYTHVSLEKCGCVDSNLFYDPYEIKICRSLKEIKCIQNVYNVDLVQNRFNGIFDSECPLECYSDFYTARTSFNNFPTYAYARNLLTHPVVNRFWQMNKSMTVDDVKKSVSRVNIHLDDLKYTLLTEVATMTILNLISNTGGLFGLFLGMSLMSLIEIFELVSQIISFIFRNQFNAINIVNSQSL